MRWASICIVMALAAAACSGSGEQPETVQDYVDAMAVHARKFADEFRDGDVGEPGGPPPEEFPIGGDLVFATELYSGYEDLLAAWEDVDPPEAVGAAHAALVAGLAELQEKIGKYLGDEALESGSLDFASIGTKFGPTIRSAEEACRDLQEIVVSLGADGEVFLDCVF